MGRVYNALIKADRLTDRQRPIGRPAVQGQYPDAEIGSSATQQAQADLSSLSRFDFDDVNHSAPVDFNNGFALSEPFIAPPTVEHFTSSPRVPERGMHGGASRDSASSVSLPIKPTFVEPREVTNIKSLSVDPHWAALTGSDTLASERYRTLAVRVTRRQLKTLVVTSAEDGEGKSTVAANLAWVMAKRDNRRVLLIDASPRSNSAGRMLNSLAGRGWLDMTDVSSELAETIIRLDPNGLYVMSTGGAHKQAISNDSDLDDALASSQFEKLLAELSGYFDFIVIDAPTICGSIGAQQLASIAGGTIVIARAGRTHHSRVMTAVELVPQERRLGMVLNESEVSKTDSGNASIIKRLFGRKN